MTNHSIVALVKNRKTGEPYTDNLCLFRCLALHQGAGEDSLERATKALFDRYLQETSLAGEYFGDLCIVEKIFEVAIHGYSIDENGQATSVWRSGAEFQPMYVNLYGEHFSYIKDIRSYSECFVCYKCDKIFTKRYRLSRHEQICDTNVSTR